MNIDPTSSKYLIRASIRANGVVNKSDVVGAIFGQTEGLLGDELDLRDLQKSGRMGRIEVEITSDKGKSVGEIVISSSMDQVETSVFAAALETVERVGPCKATVKITTLEDSRSSKREIIIDRARTLLINLIKDGTISGKIAKSVFEIMRDGDKDPITIVEEKGLKQQSDPKELENLINKVITENPKNVEAYKSGKDKLFGFFVGQVMKNSNGKANPKLVNEILKKKLN